MCLFLSLFGCTVHVKLLVYVCDLPDELMDKPGPEVDDSMDCNGELFLEWEGSSVPKAKQKDSSPTSPQAAVSSQVWMYCFVLCFQK